MIISRLQIFVFLSTLAAISAVVIFFTFSNEKENPPAPSPCLLIDTDGSFDDLRALQLLECQKGETRSFVIFTEGISRREFVLHNAKYTLKKMNSNSPTFVKGRAETKNLDTSWLKVRKRDESLHGLSPRPIQKPNWLSLKKALNQIERQCTSVDVVLLGPYTSALHYSRALTKKINRFVSMGNEDARTYFNCFYDEDSCQKFFNDFGHRIEAVHLPHEDSQMDKYGFDQKFYQKISQDDDLKLWAQIFAADPSGWVPPEMLMWDDMVTFYYHSPDSFQKNLGLFSPVKNSTYYRQLWIKTMKRCLK